LKNYELPDGQIITLDSECFQCPEVLFKPELLRQESDGIHTMIYDSIMKSDVELHQEFFENIILSGGNTMFSGITERLSKEIKLLAPKSMNIKIISEKNRQNSVWIGGSILSSLDSFQNLWILKEEYDEYGPTIVNRKCF